MTFSHTINAKDVRSYRIGKSDSLDVNSESLTL